MRGVPGGRRSCSAGRRGRRLSQIFVKAGGESLVAITVAETGQPYVNVASSH
jgi:hypothetical protein